MRTIDTRKVVIAIFFIGLGLLAALLVVLGPLLDGWLGLPALGLGAANPAVGTFLVLIGGGLVVWLVYVQRE